MIWVWRVETYMHYAHSGISQKNIPPQEYSHHINGMIKSYHGLEIRKLLPPIYNDAIELAIRYHDLGKLHPMCQKWLKLSDKASDDVKMLNHVDAGVSFLMAEYARTKNFSYVIACILCHAHHIGILDFSNYFKITLSGFIPSLVLLEKLRDTRLLSIYEDFPDDNRRICDEVDLWLNCTGMALSNELIGEYTPSTSLEFNSICPYYLKMSFAALIEVDHGDVSVYYNRGRSFPTYCLFPEENLRSLEEYVKLLNKGKKVKRNKLRNEIYELCKNTKTDGSFYILDAVVGLGKTLNALVFALRMCKENKCNRIYNIIPLTNIINQTVDVYKNALSMGETYVSEIHSKCEFSSTWLRMYSSRWNSPITISTGVTFVESLLSCRPGMIKKLSHFCNSVFILDEFHMLTFQKYDLWKPILGWFKFMSEHLNCHFIFSSGTPVNFWSKFDLPLEYTDIIPSGSYYNMIENESRRVKKIQMPDISDINHLLDCIEKKSRYGSVLAVFNTVKNSAIIYKNFKAKYPSKRIYYMSSMLTPADRETILAQVKEDLSNNLKIVFISTSIIECGVDVSFKYGFREKSSHLSIFQCLGRINRNASYRSSTLNVFSFSENLLNDYMTENPAMFIGKNILNEYNLEEIGPNDTTDIVGREIVRSNQDKSGEELLNLQEKGMLRSLAEKSKVIDNTQMTIIVNKEVYMKVLDLDFIPYQDISRNSVCCYDTKYEKIKDYLKVIDEKEKLYYWNGPYKSSDLGIAETVFDL